MAPTHGGPVTHQCPNPAGLRRCGAVTSSLLMPATKSDLRKSLRAARRDHVAAQSDAIRALLFHRPPAPLVDMIDPAASIGVYHAGEAEAPASGYARFFLERGNRIALPRFDAKDGPMHFAEHADPFGESDLEGGPFGILQPQCSAAPVIPEVVFVPLIGFTAHGDRLGQGGGHYDRWLADHPEALAIGLAWDVQLCDTLPTEPHDKRMSAVVTPTRMYGPF